MCMYYVCVSVAFLCKSAQQLILAIPVYARQLQVTIQNGHGETCWYLNYGLCV